VVAGPRNQTTQRLSKLPFWSGMFG
jgi:hypothetical protein